MARKTITSANSIFTLSVAGLYAGVRIQGYSADLAFDMEPQQIAETQVGVDDHMSGGYVPHLIPMNIQLQADSDSIEVFDTIYQYMKARREIVWLTGTIEVPSTRQSYALGEGIMVNYQAVSTHNRVQAPKRFTINWHNVLASKI